MPHLVAAIPRFEVATYQKDDSHDETTSRDSRGSRRVPADTAADADGVAIPAHGTAALFHRAARPLRLVRRRGVGRSPGHGNGGLTMTQTDRERPGRTPSAPQTVNAATTIYIRTQGSTSANGWDGLSLTSS